MARRFDHIVIAAHDLDAAAQFYRQIGFQVGARNVHPWGTQNHIVQFDGAFLELISLPKGPGLTKPEPYFATFLQAFLERREGLAMLVLASANAERDHADFARHKIGIGETFDFSRRSRKPDGREVEVAFSLAFARPPAGMECGFFVCQQHFPENFWNPAFQRHNNGVNGLRSVVFCSNTLPETTTFLRDFSGFSESRLDQDEAKLVDADQSLQVLRPERFETVYGLPPIGGGTSYMAALVFGLVDLAAYAALLTDQGVPFHALNGRIIIPASAGFGAHLIFEAFQAKSMA